MRSTSGGSEYDSMHVPQNPATSVVAADSFFPRVLRFSGLLHNLVDFLEGFFSFGPKTAFLTFLVWGEFVFSARSCGKVRALGATHHAHSWNMRWFEEISIFYVSLCSWKHLAEWILTVINTVF